MHFSFTTYTHYIPPQSQSYPIPFLKMDTTKVFATKYTGYEQDPRAMAVEEYTLSHLHPPSRPNRKFLDNTLIKSSAEGLPPISTHPVFAKLLTLQCRAAGIKHILEIGTLGGYTPIFLATENPDLHVITLEVNPHHAKVAQANIEAAGVADRVEVIVGPAKDTLPKLLEEVEAGKRARLGLTYIDADKENNWIYADHAIRMSYPRALLFVDNIVRAGRLVDPKAIEESSALKGSRELVEKVGKDSRLDGLVLQTLGEKDYDGFLMAVIN